MRVQALIDDYADGNQSAFAEQIGISKQAVAKLLAGSTPSGGTLEAIVKRYPTVSRDFLLTGRGPVRAVRGDHGPARDLAPEYAPLRGAEMGELYQRWDQIESGGDPSWLKALRQDVLVALVRAEAMREDGAGSRERGAALREEAAAQRERSQAVRMEAETASRRADAVNRPSFGVRDLFGDDAAAILAGLQDLARRPRTADENPPPEPPPDAPPGDSPPPTEDRPT